MPMLYIVTSPSGKVVYAGPNQTQADYYKPTGYEFENQQYQCHVVDAVDAWATNAPANAPGRGRSR